MADVYMISCASGAVPQIRLITGGSLPVCPSVDDGTGVFVQDLMIFTSYPFPPFDSSQIDPSVVTALIGAGFLLYLTPWAAAYGFSSLLKMLR